MENRVDGDVIDLGSLRKKILTVEDVYDFCLNNCK